MKRARVGIALFCLFAAACARRGAIDTAAPIIVISIDTLRSDRLPAYGYTRVDAPAIDQFCGDSILFERAYSQCPLTLPSHASVFTGTLPSEHGIRDNLGYDLNPKSRTIAEIVKAKGYATGAAVSAIVLRGETGIKRGFDFWDDDVELDPNSLSLGRAQRSGDITRGIAQKWIGQHKSQPFFFFFHIYEPHTPYEPVEPFKSKYGETYDGEVATSDDIVGKFLAYLRQEGIYDRATIVLLSDHGEGLGDHGENEHGILLYRETIQVPLVLKMPHQAQKGTRVAAPVELIDIFPTIAEAFVSREKAKGRSLLDVANGLAKEERAMYAETYYPRLHFGWSDLHSLIVGTNHYIQAPKPELYDITSDPAEKKNLLPENRRTYVALRERIQPFIRAAAEPGAVDDEQKQQLIALGYVGSTVATSSDASLPDPKENIGKANDIGRAFGSFKAQKYEETLKVISDLLRDNPNMLDVWSLKSRALEKLNRREEAIEAARQGLRVSPTSSSLAFAVANLSLELGRLDDAEAHVRLVMKDVPTEAHRLLALVWLERKNYAKAREEANAALGEKRDRAGALVLFGRIAQAEGHFDDALSKYDQALALLASKQHQPLPKLNFYRGDMLARLGRAEEAEAALLSEVKLYPTDPQAYKNLVLLYAMEGRTREATDLIFSLENAAPTPPSYLAISEILKIIGDRNGSRFWAARGLERYPNDPQLRKAARTL